MLQRETVRGEKNLSPHASGLRIAALAEFSPIPMLPIGPRRVWAASGSVGTADGWWSPQLETNSKRLLLRGEGLFGMKKPCCPGPSNPTIAS